MTKHKRGELQVIGREKLVAWIISASNHGRTDWHSCTPCTGDLVIPAVLIIMVAVRTEIAMRTAIVVVKPADAAA